MSKVPLSVILMVHNEEETIADEIKRYYIEIIKKIPGSEFIIAEDGSTDKTRYILYELKRKLPLVLLTTPHKRGYAKSLRLAMEKAKGDLILYADAGEKHDPHDFWELHKKIGKFDFVSGYKVKRNDPFYRLLLTWGLNAIVNCYFDVSFRDIDCGYKLLSKKTVESLIQQPWILTNNISLEIVLTAVYKGHRGIEIPVKHFARKYGPSRGLPLDKIPRVVVQLLISFPKLKRHLGKMREKIEEKKMLTNYDSLFHTGKYRLIWEGKISFIYKLPKYLKIIRQLLGPSKNQIILEIGSGDGEIAEKLLEEKKIHIKKYVATELSVGGVNQAKHVLKRFKNVYIEQMDATNLKFPDKSFDTVFAIDVMHHVSDPYKMGQEMLRVSKNKVFLIESNALSLPRRIAELQKRYKLTGESSYYPWEYKRFFTNRRTKLFKIRPFLFMVPHAPATFIPLNVFFSELLEKIPLLNWQCSGVIIEVLIK